MEVVSLAELLSACLDISLKSSEIIREVAHSGNLQKQFKIGDDPVTQADINAQALMEASLKRNFPKLTIIGEEEVHAVSPVDVKINLLKHIRFPSHLEHLNVKDVVLWIDPLDGTRSFVGGHYGHVTTLFGVSYRGLPIAGIVHYPFSGEQIWGVSGLGVFGCEVKLSKEYDNSLAHGFFYKGNKLERLRRLYPQHRLVPSGGTGHCCIEVLKGNVGGFTSFGGSKWDTCGIEAIFNAVGGKVLTRNGKQFFYHKEISHPNHGSIASLQNIHLLIEKNDNNNIKSKL